VSAQSKTKIKPNHKAKPNQTKTKNSSRGLRPHTPLFPKNKYNSKDTFPVFVFVVVFVFVFWVWVKPYACMVSKAEAG